MDTERAAPAPTAAQLFLTFLGIGAMGFGGPFALVSLMEKIVVQKGWMSTELFTESTGMAAMAPGPISSNTSAVVGYRLRGLPGAVATYTAFHLPAVVLVVILAATFQRLESLQVVKGALKGVYAAVVGLLVAVGLKMGKTTIKDVRSGVLAVLALLALVLLKANPALLVLGTGLAGYLILR